MARGNTRAASELNPMSEVRGLNASVRLALKDMLANRMVGTRDLKTAKDINKLSTEEQKQRVANGISSMFYYVAPPTRGEVYRRTDEGAANDKKRLEESGMVDAKGKPISLEAIRAEYVDAIREAKGKHNESVSKIEDEADLEGTKGKSPERTGYFKVGETVFKFKWAVESETNYEMEDPGERSAYYYDTLNPRIDPKSIELA